MKNKQIFIDNAFFQISFSWVNSFKGGYIKKLGLNEYPLFRYETTNSSCSCGSGTGSDGFHTPEAKRVSRSIKKAYSQKRFERAS